MGKRCQGRPNKILQNNLQNEDKTVIKEHIKSCDSCNKELQQIESLEKISATMKMYKAKTGYFHAH